MIFLCSEKNSIKMRWKLIKGIFENILIILLKSLGLILILLKGMTRQCTDKGLSGYQKNKYVTC